MLQCCGGVTSGVCIRLCYNVVVGSQVVCVLGCAACCCGGVTSGVCIRQCCNVVVGSQVVCVLGCAAMLWWGHKWCVY